MDLYEDAMREVDLRWCREHFSSMADGGIWAVPRSGLIFTRRGERLELTGRMPWTEELAQAAAEGADVPLDGLELHNYQQADYDLIRGRFEAAGIPVMDTSSAGASA